MGPARGPRPAIIAPTPSCEGEPSAAHGAAKITLTFGGAEDSSLQTSFVVDDTALTTG
ncbi:hypothetical protein [Streptomyces sp. NPDC003480]